MAQDEHHSVQSVEASYWHEVRHQTKGEYMFMT
jgi:hypothetical protein